MDNLIDTIGELFQETGKAHHQAFIEVDGVDPEWPAWYAEHMHEKLCNLLNAKFTKSELIYLLILVDREQRLESPGGDWMKYYGRFFTERYVFE